MTRRPSNKELGAIDKDELIEVDTRLMDHSYMMCPVCRALIDTAKGKVSVCSNCRLVYHQGCANTLNNSCAVCGNPLILKSYRALRVFLCHSSHDKPSVINLHKRLDSEGNIESWLDEMKLLPGQDWDFEIWQAIRGSDVVYPWVPR